MDHHKYHLNERSRVAEFYAGKSVFITGVSGFIGGLLLEKLLYSCDQLDKVYVLVRKKNGLSEQEQTNEIIEHVIFTRIRKEKPQVFKKVVTLFGDLLLPDLGLDESDTKKLTDNVSVVYHVAASVKFTEPLRKALEINVQAPIKVLQLCKRMRHIQAFVHVSTAFSQVDKQFIDECVYPPPAPLEQVYEFAETCSSNEELHKFLGKWPNTYTFTKALAEHLVSENRGDIPTAIVRPSMVTTTLKEPLTGYIGNWNGPTGYLHHVTEGNCRFMYGTGNNVVDFIPADYLVNLTIVAATECKREVKVYNCVSSPRNPVTSDYVFKKYVETAVKRRESGSRWPRVFHIPSKLVVCILNFLFMTLPSYIADLRLWVSGKPTKYVKFYNKISHMIRVTDFFTYKEWRWADGNCQALFHNLSPVDQRIFYFNTCDIDWNVYVFDYYLGVRTYLLKK